MATALVTTTEGLRPRESGLGLGTWPRNAPVDGFRTCTPLSPAAMNALPPTSRNQSHKPSWSAVKRSRSEEHTSELQSLTNLVCRLLLEKKKKTIHANVVSHNSSTKQPSITINHTL